MDIQREINEALRKKIMEEVLDVVDTKQLKAAAKKGVQEYFKSEIFKDDIVESFSDEGIGYAMGKALSASVAKAVKDLQIEFK